MANPRLFRRDFTMVVIGQIISLFGNAVLRFALPLYLLNQTQSPALFGIVSACSFIPMILLSPVGGIIADRINKRNIMVILDFATAGLALLFTLLLGKLDLVVLIVCTLILLYGIQGAYQPSVQASIPALVTAQQLVPANSVVTLVNSLAGLIGPVIGGAVYGFYGITPVLWVSIFCFFASAVMEIFIHIPFEKKPGAASIAALVRQDMAHSFRFIKNEKPIIAKIALFIAAINLVYSALLIIGLPVIITQKLGFEEQLGNQLYGVCQGVMAAGGLAGGILSGALSKRLDVSQSHILLFGCSFLLLPVALVLLLPVPGLAAYIVILACCFLAMATSTIFSIQMMAYVQLITPGELIGKIMSLALCVCMCASPLGQAVYGWLFEAMSGQLSAIFLVAAILSFLIAVLSRRSFALLRKPDPAQPACGERL